MPKIGNDNSISKTGLQLKPELFIIDVDGVMTDSASYYTADGKVMKKFGPDDHDALTLLRPFLEIRFVSRDKRGFEITCARIETDMKIPLDQVSTIRSIDWIRESLPCLRSKCASCSI